jgi:translation initiation factor 1
MAKRRRPKDEPAVEPKSSPFNSAFSGLGSLRDQLPVGDAPEPPAPAREAQPADPTLPKKVVVRRERKGRKGKTVTRISGFGAKHDIADWAQRMKRGLGCGGSVEDDDIILAGDIADRAAAWLEAAGLSRVVRGN